MCLEFQLRAGSARLLPLLFDGRGCQRVLRGVACQAEQCPWPELDGASRV